ncbi:TRAP transporter small permease [Aquisalinus flavus]|uniref:TRAP transporter small permease protein n=1 Tax=Aquisalinus flavus TaxID=1526572 RepID=A0A8J2Y5K0_9PROT|nr:TRAP transporter small permease [Aquisalinus flavus]GGC98799.1 C4-dicarboxylate ABC transporter permease [Aquisalinus flavus]
MPDFLTQFSKLLSRVSLTLAAAGLCAMTLIISWQVFARYVLNASPSWTEQASLLLMIWFIFLATAVGIRENFHIRITAMVDPLGSAARRAMEIITHIIVGLIGIGMILWGIQLTGYTWPHNIPTLGMSRGFAYMPVIVSGAMIAFFALEHILAAARGQEVEPIWN